MEKQNIEVHMAPGSTGLTITHIDGGKRVDEPQMGPIGEDCNIYGPGEYIRKHYAQFFPQTFSDGTVSSNSPVLQKGLIKFCRNFPERKLYIIFDEDPQHPIDGALIEGSLEENPELKGWELNSAKPMTPAKAVTFIRQRAHHFGSVAEAADLIKLFKNFEVTFETTRKKTDDDRGNIQNAIDEQIRFKSGELPEEIRITLPLFKGTPARTLRLEIHMERQGNEVGLSFYCLELENTLRSEAEAIMTEEIAPFRQLFVVLEKQ